MNYLEFFELHQEPFSNAPVARFYYDSQQHSQALMRLRYAVEQMKGLAVLVGDIGAGKTTLARRLLDSLPEEQFEAALLMIVHAETTQQWLLSRIALLLGVDNPSDDKLKLLSQVYQRLVAIHDAGRKAVVLIDEAQMLRSRDLMEEFRGLLNLELTEKKLLTFVFFGLPDLDDNLKLDEPLAGRVALRVRLESLSRASTAAYTAHRLKLAGARRPLFSEAAIDAVHRFSRGTPRLNNTVCDNALLESFFVKQAQVDEALVARVAQDLGLTANALPATAPVPAAIPAPSSRAAAGSFGAAPARSEIPAPRPVPRPAMPPVSESIYEGRPAAPPARAAAAAATARAPEPAPVAAPRPEPLRSIVPAAAKSAPPAPAAILDLAIEAELEDTPAEDLPEAEIAHPESLETRAPAPPAIAPPLPNPVADTAAAIEAIDSMNSEDVEIPQIDALDDIDSILDQLEDKG